MPRHTRYQGAILQDHAVLMIRHRHHHTGETYWLLPGGGREPGESAEACVAREMEEETNLAVEVGALLLDEPAPSGDVYLRRKTYLCKPMAGQPSPGIEPELEAAAAYGIAEVRWFDLRDEHTWDPLLHGDSISYPMIKRLKWALGYRPDGD